MDTEELTSPEPIGVGSTVRTRLRSMGREYVLTWEIVEHEPPSRQTIESTSGPFATTLACAGPATLVPESEFETEDGVTRLVDCVPPGGAAESLVRVVEGVRGSVPTRMELTIRLDYGATVPWVTSDTGGVSAMASPDALDERPSRSTPIGLSLGRAPRPLRTCEKVSLPVLSTFVRAADRWPMVGDG